MSDQMPLLRPNAYPTSWGTGYVSESSTVDLWTPADNSFFYNIQIVAFCIFLDLSDISIGAELQWYDAEGNYGPVANLGITISGDGIFSQDETWTNETEFDTARGMRLNFSHGGAGSSYASAWASGYTTLTSW